MKAPALVYTLALKAALAEIQRLRAAMVHAIDDAEWGARGAGDASRTRFRGIAKRLKAALEKK